MISRLFLAHPRSVGESYLEHMGAAGGFAVTMVAAGLACLVHAVLPFAFERTASRAVRRLHAHMAARRGAEARSLDPAGPPPAPGRRPRDPRELAG